MPENTVKVDRTTKWGNPFVIGKDNPFIPGAMVQDRLHAFVLYRSFASLNGKIVAAARAELAGKNLACCGALLLTKCIKRMNVMLRLY